MVQNEAPYLHEWIEYHRLLGVKHFWLYNHESTDDYHEVLDPYISEGIVELIQWPSKSQGDWTPHQMKAYNDCINRSRGKTMWLAVIDIDEYIVPVTANSLPELLSNYRHIGGLQIFWQFFGTSGVYEIPENMTLAESLVQKATKNHPWNYNFKTICQPAVVKNYYVHGATYHQPWHELFPHGTRGGAHQPINIDIVRIHHYWTRDEKYFREKKIPRRTRIEPHPFDEPRIQQIIRDLDVEVDDAILRFVPELRKRLAIN